MSRAKRAKKKENKTSSDSSSSAKDFPGRKTDKSGSASFQPPTAGSGKPAANSGGTYLNPENFAERLMHALENGIASDCLWWLGEGKAIGIHPEKLKKNAVLNSHFQGNRYSSFVRYYTWIVFV
jgi:hypothetical protein